MSITQHAQRNLVAGELVEAVDGSVREVVNPATGDVIAEVPEGAQADVDRAVAAARAAFPGWRDTTPGARAEALLELAPFVSEMPHGGFKESGYGKDMSIYSLEDYTQIKHVMAKLA
jgi:acyl-CoA reductase-like NAD-dependent aldehyde dehydrogenase